MEKELENFDSLNEEQENNDSLNVEEVETQESDAVEESTEQEEGESKDEFTEREKQYYARMKKLEKELKDAKGKSPEAESEVQPDRVDRLELKYAGVEDKEDQTFVLEYAKAKGISLEDAVKNRVVQAELKESERVRTSQSASPRNNNRAPGQQDEVGMWVKKYKKDGSLPDNSPALTAKILDALQKGA